MVQIKTILVALGREGNPSRTLERAAMLARRFNARLEIFLCDAEGAHALKHQYDAAGAREARRACLAELYAWADRLWRSLQITDIAATIETAYETPLCQAITRKVERSHPDLVVRGIGAEGVSTFSVADLDLIRTCSAPVLLTCGKAWHVSPVFAAAIDVSGDESKQVINTVLATADSFAQSCDGTLELVYASRFEEGPPDAAVSLRARIAGHAEESCVERARVHVLTGDPLAAIPRYITRHGCDLLVLGALTHHESLTVQVGTLTGRLIECVDCDLLLVRPSAARQHDFRDAFRELMPPSP
jgi:nucleotide-binding universal stress UspA family protein